MSNILISDEKALNALSEKTLITLNKAKGMPKLKVMPKCGICQEDWCESCKVCENPTCAACGFAVRSKAEAITSGLFFPRTQKAKGYCALKNAGFKVPYPFYVISELDDISVIIEKHINKGNSTKYYFGRPCPVRPRHGFVDSRSIDMTFEAVQALYNEARNADPEAELLICPEISATANAIITPNKIAIGAGNAGATAGKDSFEFPLLGTAIDGLSSDLLNQGGIGPNDAPYIEAVTNGTENAGPFSWFLTQLRAGPKLAGIEKDFIPERTQVTKIIEASGDLQEWEEQTKHITPGTIVVHMGGSLISHYGVHCLINKVPIMTSRIPTIGEWLEKEPNVDAKAFNPDAIKRGMEIGLQLTFNDSFFRRRAVALMVVTLHNAPAMTNGYGVWLGIALITMLRLGMAASHGEARHRNEMKSKSRDAVYLASFKDFFKSRETLSFAYASFKYDSWSQGYGGTKWAACTEAIILLDIAIKTFLADSTEQSIKDMIAMLNTAVNQAHNNGWWMNKFADKTTFNNAAIQNIHALLEASGGIWSVIPYFRNTSNEEIAKYITEGGIEQFSKSEWASKRAKNSLSLIEDTDDSDNEGDSDNSPCDCPDCKNMVEDIDIFKDTYDATLPPKSMIVDKPKKSKSSSTPTTKFYKKSSLSTCDSILKTHVRFSALDSKHMDIHMQAVIADPLGYKYYISNDYNLECNVKEVLKAFQDVEREESYSSNAHGYIPLDISSDINDVYHYTNKDNNIHCYLNAEGGIENFLINLPNIEVNKPTTSIVELEEPNLLELLEITTNE